MDDYKKPNFSEFTINLAKQLAYGFCQVEGCINPAIDLHHRLSNTKLNNKKYPLFVQSIFNCFVICREHHDNYSLLLNIKITDQQAQAYETWLENYKEEV